MSWLYKYYTSLYKQYLSKFEQIWKVANCFKWRLAFHQRGNSITTSSWILKSRIKYFINLTVAKENSRVPLGKCSNYFLEIAMQGEATNPIIIYMYIYILTNTVGIHKLDIYCLLEHLYLHLVTRLWIWTMKFCKVMAQNRMNHQMSVLATCLWPVIIIFDGSSVVQR